MKLPIRLTVRAVDLVNCRWKALGVLREAAVRRPAESTGFRVVARKRR